MPASVLQTVKPKVIRTGGGSLLNSEQFLDWLQPGVFADLIGGQIFMHSPVNLRHATLVNFLERLLAAYIKETDLGGVLHRESVAVRLSARETFMPDLGCFTARQAERLGETHAAFAPMFVAEALSPSTAKNDQGPKFASYELHEVQEYWILDPQKLQHRFFRRAGDMLEEFATSGDKIASTSIQGFWVKRAWLDPDKAPKVSTCLKEIMRSSKR
ncbi:Uma2 family endonuclease [Prosthecobacter sp.]|uniref:Uma2 family endonuclease n=1 Tax=Prosthecobacter sp. TaxID=1965333 RepID=UPI003783BFC9